MRTFLPFGPSRAWALCHWKPRTGSWSLAYRRQVLMAPSKSPSRAANPRWLVWTFSKVLSLWNRELCPFYNPNQPLHPDPTEALDGGLGPVFSGKSVSGRPVSGWKPGRSTTASRVDAQGRGSWDRATRSLALLDKAGVETNLLCVITGPLARSAQKVYHSLNKLAAMPFSSSPAWTT